MRALLVLLTSSAILSCSGASSGIEAGAEAKPAPPVEATQPESELSRSGPEPKDALDWVMAALAGPSELTAAEVEIRFAASFLEQVPSAKVIAIFEQLAAVGPYQIVEREQKGSRFSLLLQSKQARLRMNLATAEEAPHQIVSLLFKPEANEESLPKSYQEVLATLATQGTDTHFFIAELVKDKCVATQSHNGDARLAIGSAFKLWVLLALGEMIDETASTWDTELAIDETRKSLPSGTMQNEAPGTKHSLRKFATQMISISDNTATDHLIHHVGRKAVEKALRLSKHSAPRSNMPFLSTREMFVLKLAASDEEIDRYRKASLAKKRKLLAALRSRKLELSMASDWTGPRALDVEWFATAPDLCGVMGALAEKGGYDPSSEVLTILGKNPGVPVDREQWSFVGFKGGSEPGVMNLSWLLQRADGRWFVVVLTVNNEDEALDESAIVRAATAALQLLGAEAASR